MLEIPQDEKHCYSKWFSFGMMTMLVWVHFEWIFVGI